MPDDLFGPLGPTRIIMERTVDGALMTREAVILASREADAILNQGEVRVDAGLLEQAPRLRIVANIARGFDNLDLDAMTRRGVWATNVPDAFTAPTAEVALGLMLMVMRRLAEGDRSVRAGSWASFDPGRWDGHTLVGKTLGLIGFGLIGQAVAERARAFGMSVLYHQRRRIDASGAVWASLDDLLARADVVSLHVPATPETYHLIDKDAFASMRPGAVLINTARGSVVDEQALVAALQSGRLGGAGLDVAEQEPRIDPVLRTMDNVVITPHLGGGTVESRLAARQHAIANVAAVLRGERPLSPLNELPVAPAGGG
ncbi:MAG: 2-hydroxyacid dehydrogenase [Thermomicrobiales bacterium]